MIKVKELDADKIRSIPIYRFIQDYICRIPVLSFRKGEYLFRGEDIEKPIFYIINGNVEVENITYSGKKLIVENVGKNTFTGCIADMHDVDLQLSGVAVTAVEALIFSESIMEKLMKNDRFLIYFYKETSSRVFKTYKEVLSKLLFSPGEIMAHYILDNAKGGVFAYKSAYRLCENVGISRRGIYDILYRFEKMKCIEKKDSSVYEIVDQVGLERQAEHMIDFMR